MKTSNLFAEKKLLGMVHCLPLPGTVGYCGSMKRVIQQAIQDAETLEKSGIGGIIIENMNDNPPAAKMDMEQMAALAVVSALVKERVNVPVGIDAAFCDWEASLCIANAVEADFIRIPVFVDTVITTSGIVFPCAREVMKKRKELGAENILLLCDVQVKHSHMLVKEICIEESASTAEEAGADAIIVTGAHTGQSAPIDTLKRLRSIVRVPLLVGSGFNAGNAAMQWPFVDGAIVGSALKKDGVLTNPVDLELTREVVKAVNSI